ncbi:hypothetical protein C8F04DRAFT_957252 [Mycena alexandri]|uniref:Adenosine deaminase n=1 Tax=Mycena alexandri TaxID=1745969 RepID=A0AAD6SXV4_9AGAR|nr:hypothetical protein C8F04DRAFT_957252 [Mycena alexandri]
MAPFVYKDFEHYKDERAALINRDRSPSLRPDFAQVLSEIETKADEVVRKIRTAEAASIWGAKYSDIVHPFPGMEFLTGRSIILKTKIFDILTKARAAMSSACALLHVHLDATLNPKLLLEFGLEEPAMHVCVSERLTSANIFTTLPEFRALPKDDWVLANSTCGLTDKDYVPNTWVQIRKARDTFDTSMGGPECFDQWVERALSISSTEAYRTHNTVAKVEYFSTLKFQGLVLFTPIWRKYIREFLRSSVEDQISYIEVRVVFAPEYMVGEDGAQDVPHREWLLIFDQVQKELKAKLERQGREDDFVGARIIYTALRFIPIDELEWHFQDCIALKKEFPHLIAGFDIAGPEDNLPPLSHYAEALLRFREQQKEALVDIPLILHAGETCGDGTFADMNLFDAILLGSERIGHGFSLVKHPKLMEICKERGILIEMCPISNEVLRPTASMPMHPLPILMNNGIPLAISSDDPGIFGNTGLSFDMYQVLVSSEVTGLTALRELARNSLKYSTLEREDKKRALESWERRWEIFVQGIVDTFVDANHAV